MNALIRTAVVVLFGGLLTLGVFGLRLAYSPNDSQESRRREELLRRRQATFNRLKSRQQAVQEWIAQRRTLAETMQQFRELDQKWPDYSAFGRRSWPGPDEERHYQRIISLVEWILLDRPAELALVLHRLKKDYQQLLADRQTPSTAAEPIASDIEAESE